jgi:outer membrane receptor for ferrienterochelin and colicins
VKLTNSFVNPSRNDNYFLEQDISGNLDFAVGNLYNGLSFSVARSDFFLDEEQEMSILPRYNREKVGLDVETALSDTAYLSFGGSYLNMVDDDQTSSFGSFNRSDTTRADGYVEGDVLLGDTSSLSVLLYHNYYLRVKDKYSSLLGWEGEEKERENLSSLEVYGRFYLTPNNELTVGGGGAYNTLYKYNLEETGATKNIDSQFLVLQDEQFREDRYSVIFGLRAERNSTFGYFAAPKVSGMYYLAQELRLFGGLGVGYRAPNFSDLYLVKDDPGHPVVLGNEDLVPEKSIGTNLGLEYSAGGLFTQVNFFYNELFDEIVYEVIPNPDPMDDRDVYRKKNIDRSYRLGADAELGVSLFESFGFSAGYNFVYGYNRTTREKISDIPMHTLRGKISYDSEPLGLLVYVRGRYLSGIDDEDDARTILDFFISKNILNNVRVFAGVDNFTDTVDEFLGPYEGLVISTGVEGWFQ